MSNIKLFRISEDGAAELQCNFVRWERDLQVVVERRMEQLFGIRFLAHEYGTGIHNTGIIDSLGIDENGCPVIVEYKRRNNENVITQGLYYMDWLQDHRYEMESLVLRKLGPDAAKTLEFANPRLICIASRFSRFDERAIFQIGRNIELVQYKFYEPDLLLLDYLPTPLARPAPSREEQEECKPGMDTQMQLKIRSMLPDTEKLYLELLAYVESLGEDVGVKFLKHYIAMTRVRNFACLEPGRNSLKLYLNLEPTGITLEEGFSRDVRNIGHHGTGDLELEIRTAQDLEKSFSLIEQAYLDS